MVLVTGGLGFIGTNLIHHLLKKRHKVLNLDKKSYASNNPIIHANHVWIKFDLSSYGVDAIFSILKKHKIREIIHLAAESHVDNSIKGPKNFIHSNVLGTFNLIEACRLYWGDDKDCRFIHVSTDEVYGSISKGSFTEKSNYAPNSPYSASKASSDLLVYSYVQTYGFPAIITNCANNFGPHQHAEKFTPTIIRSILKNEKVPIYGVGNNVRDWLYVEDHCDALYSILERGKIGQKYNVGANNEMTNLNFLKEICRLMKVDFKSSYQLVEDRKGHDYRYSVNCKKIKKELDWKPKTDFYSGLMRTIDFYKKSGQ